MMCSCQSNLLCFLSFNSCIFCCVSFALILLPGRFPLLPPQGMPQPYPMPHRRAPHMSWSSHPPPPPPSHSPTTRPIGGAMQTARHRNAIPPAGALLPSPLAPAPIPSKAGKHQLRTTATPFIPTAVSKHGHMQIHNVERLCAWLHYLV